MYSRLYLLTPYSEFILPLISLLSTVPGNKLKSMNDLTTVLIKEFIILENVYNPRKINMLQDFDHQNKCFHVIIYNSD